MSKEKPVTFMQVVVFVAIVALGICLFMGISQGCQDIRMNKMEKEIQDLQTLAIDQMKKK